ncbi:MAG: BamA/TamA family outer membrane protein, partial [Myxococcota bacterium]|nr:BamA/TamA family outer membrane protein [Myxococcota bacterium]
MGRLLTALALVLVLWAAPAEASPPSDTPVPAEEPEPSGWDFAGLPLLNFTTDRGFGYGLYASVFHHGAEGAQVSPYLFSLGGQFYQTTGGYQFHKLLLDIPDIFGSGIRFDLTTGYETWDSSWYFGQGNQVPRLAPEDTPENFYASDLKSLWVIPTLRIPLAGDHALFVSHTVRSTQVDVYPGSLLELDAPAGIEGGVFSQLSVGWILDRRDVEPSTTQGIFPEVSLRVARGFLGSRWTLWGLNATHRQWFRLRDDGRLVLAVRAGIDLKSPGAPFFHQHVLGGSQWVALGGNMALRGLPFGRYRGDLTVYSNTELRAELLTFRILGQRLDVLGISYVDLGRVWIKDAADAGSPIHFTAGVGPRLVYNRVFAVRTDIGVGL